ncbi:unnamed protein product, partial [Urochloa humidicola]
WRCGSPVLGWGAGMEWGGAARRCKRRIGKVRLAGAAEEMVAQLAGAGAEVGGRRRSTVRENACDGDAWEKGSARFMS